MQYAPAPPVQRPPSAPGGAAATLPDSLQASLKTLFQRHPERPDSLLPLLHDLQDAVGYIPPESIANIASHFNLSRAEVHGVVTYYHFFRTTPPPRHQMAICRAEACQARGANALISTAEQKLGCHLGGHHGDYSLEAAYCLGLCANGPVLQLDEQLHAAMTADKLTQLLSQKG